MSCDMAVSRPFSFFKFSYKGDKFVIKIIIAFCSIISLVSNNIRTRVCVYLNKCGLDCYYLIGLTEYIIQRCGYSIPFLSFALKTFS